MPKWIEYVLKKKPADEDMLMLEDAESKSNKRVPFSGIADWLIEKIKKNNLISGALRFKGSSAYAALPGKGAAENDYYYCSDGNGTNGPGYYAWNGSAWIWIGNNDKGIDKSLKVEGAAAEAAATGEAIASLKEDTNNDIKNIENAIYEHSVEKSYSDEDTIISDGVINAGNGNVQIGGNGYWLHSDYIAIDGSPTSFTITETMDSGTTEYNNGWGLAFYDANKKYVGGYPYQKSNNVSVIVPEKSVYFRFSNQTNRTVNITIKSVVYQQDTFVDKRIQFYTKKPFAEWIKKDVYEYKNIRFLLDINGIAVQLIFAGNNQASIRGFIPTIIGSKYRIKVEAPAPSFLKTAYVCVVDGDLVKKFFDNTFSIAVNTPSGTYTGLWGTSLEEAEMTEDGTKYELEFEIPSYLDGSNGLYIVWNQNYLYMTQGQPLNAEIEQISVFPVTEDAMSIELPYDGIVNCARKDPRIRVYGLGDSTNSDDATRNSVKTKYENAHVSPTKIIASKLGASKYKNYSFPGATISNAMLANASIVPNDASHVIIICGINDVNKGQIPVGNIDDILSIENIDDIPTDSMLGQYVKAVRILRSRLSRNAQIICVSPFYYKDENIPERLADFRNGLRKMCWSIGCKRGLRFVDGCDVGITQDNWRLYCRDTAHPLIEGQTMVASHIMEHITPYEIVAEQFDLPDVKDGISMKPTWV